MTGMRVSDGRSRRCLGRRDVELRIVGREAILHDPIGAKTHVINGSAARAWELCDGRTLEAVIDGFAASYGRTPDEIRGDAERIVDHFDKLGLLE